MPSTYAHRRFGADVLVQLPRELREKITPYRPLYDMGLHGPDLMFYYRALQSNLQIRRNRLQIWRYL